MSDFGYRADTHCAPCDVEWAHFHAGPWCWLCGEEGRPKFKRFLTGEEQADRQMEVFLLSRSELP